MSDHGLHALAHLTTDDIRRAVVIEVTESGTVIVAVGGADGTRCRCDTLVTTDTAPVLLAPCDEVLVLTLGDSDRGLVIGRIGPSRGLTPESDDVPDTLVLEAKHSLTLRVGDGSITIRDDGKILIKGKDLVSHAQRMNRIKGGAVSIN